MQIALYKYCSNSRRDVPIYVDYTHAAPHYALQPGRLTSVPFPIAFLCRRYRVPVIVTRLLFSRGVTGRLGVSERRKERQIGQERYRLGQEQGQERRRQGGVCRR